MNKKLQVFVSSIYTTDFIEERKIIVQTILDAGHIPVLFEFSTINASSIKKFFDLIDSSDVYIVLTSQKHYFTESGFLEGYELLELMYTSDINIYYYTIVLDRPVYYNGCQILKSFKYKSEKVYQTFPRMKNIFIGNANLNSVIIRELNDISLHNSNNNKITKDNKKNALSNFTKLLYNQNTNSFISSLKSKNAYSNIMHYLDIYSKYGMESIQKFSANKCIIDQFGNPISNINTISIDVSEINDWILNELNRNPTDLYKLSSRRFEELVAELLIRKGYNVELTTATRDGGKDIYAARKDDLGSFLYVVECKKYKPTHKVGVNVLRDLYGVLSKERATYGVAVTTSYFSKPAQDFRQELQFKMSLQDFDSLKQWLCDVT